MRKILVLACALVLGGCVTQSGGTVVVATTVDTKIAAASAKLAKECTLLAIAIESGRLFSNSSKLQKALDAAEGARGAFCSAPPTDVNSAIATVARVAISINTALAQK